MQPIKKPWLSKTLILNFLVATLAIFWPAGKEFIATHGDITLAVFSGVNFLLRLITSDKISLED